MTSMKKRVEILTARGLYRMFSLLPLQDKVVGSSFYGMKYENNPRFVMEALYRQNQNLKLVWIQKKNSDFTLPPYIKGVGNKLSMIYEYATAKVWIDSHQIPLFADRRKKQLFIEMFHGGLGMKKIANDINITKEKGNFSKKPQHTADQASLYISNSDFMDDVIRGALNYSGKIWKCGYPKNDILHQKTNEIRNKILNHYHLDLDTKFIIYAPTYRKGDSFTPYNIDFSRLCRAFSARFGGEWKVLIHLHPNQQTMMKNYNINGSDYIVDANDYENMQELIVGCDSLISDYSSCIFEAAERQIPCFVYATDYEEYKAVQGVYLDLTELPFPWAKNNDELEEKVLNFYENEYEKDRVAFLKRMGLVISDHSSEEVADLINVFIKQGIIDLKGKIK